MTKLDKLMADAKIIYQEVLEVGFDPKTERAILKNIQWIGENVLVAEKRVRGAK